MTAGTRVVALSALFALLLTMSLVASSPLATVHGELLSNGDFESGFAYLEGCGMVGESWQCFTSNERAVYGFYDEMSAPGVWEGEHSQLIEIKTRQIGGGTDSCAGIFQKVNVSPGDSYEFTIHGMLRADDNGPCRSGYRIQVGFDHSGGDDWTTVTDWIELPWNDYHPRTTPGSFHEYSTTVEARASELTVFVRLCNVDWYWEIDLNIDGISLFGPVAGMDARGKPSTVEEPVPPEPPKPDVTCDGPNLLVNGDFEGGFVDGVGNNWTAFDNDAAASYGFCDDMWAPVVSGGEHSQLIDINTMSWGASDPDRYAGIYQTICWLCPGTIYELSLHGMIRQGEHGWQDADPYRYRVQWGYTIDGSTVWTNVDNWQEIPWDNVYPRTAPGAMTPFSLQFQAPTSKITLFLRVWKKWGDSEEQVIVNLDEISLRACAPVPPSLPGPQCWIHVVQRGDTLSAIAAAHGTTVAAIVADNDMANPNVIYVRQELQICDPSSQAAG